jgi:hypothetical protein
MNSSIKKSLKQKLYSARKTIELNNDIYVDDEHERMCLYYKKYQELVKQFSTINTKITYNTLKVDNHILSENHEDDTIIFKENTITTNLLYNEYNKKFINKLYVICDISYYEMWIYEQNNFIKSLNPKEIYTLRCHTHDGDIIINYFINNNFKIDIDIDEVRNGDRDRKSTIIINKKMFKTNRVFILFYYQIKEFLDSNLPRLELEQYIIDNYKTFDWNKILLLYIRDINLIFSKTPKVKNTIVIYRGVSSDYYLKDSSKGFHISKTLCSHTLDHKTAFVYSSPEYNLMRVKLPKGSKAILIDNISPYNESEVLMPFDTKYYIDYPRRLINYYKDSDICPDDTKSKKLTVTDLSVVIEKSKS